MEHLSRKGKLCFKASYRKVENGLQNSSPPQIRAQVILGTTCSVLGVTELKRISRPGLRKFVSVPEIPAVLGGMGLAILSTSKGIMSGKEARTAKVGGEILCTIA